MIVIRIDIDRNILLLIITVATLPDTDTDTGTVFIAIATAATTPLGRHLLGQIADFRDIRGIHDMCIHIPLHMSISIPIVIPHPPTKHLQLHHIVSTQDGIQFLRSGIRLPVDGAENVSFAEERMQFPCRWLLGGSRASDEQSLLEVRQRQL